MEALNIINQGLAVVGLIGCIAVAISAPAIISLWFALMACVFFLALID